jgi:hypothetical protein
MSIYVVSISFKVMKPQIYQIKFSIRQVFAEKNMKRQKREPTACAVGSRQKTV